MIEARRERLPNNRVSPLVGAVPVVFLLAIGLARLLKSTAEQTIRRRVIDTQKQAAETAAALQRTDRITTVLCGTASPLPRERTQTCTAVSVNGGRH